jgi:hypothetical protein
MGLNGERLTTREISTALGREDNQVLALLHAAGVPHTRAGQRGMILWDGASVRALVNAMQRNGARQ